jgi:hypothetical protein
MATGMHVHPWQVFQAIFTNPILFKDSKQPHNKALLRKRDLFA